MKPARASCGLYSLDVELPGRFFSLFSRSSPFRHLAGTCLAAHGSSCSQQAAVGAAGQRPSTISTTGTSDNGKDGGKLPPSDEPVVLIVDGLYTDYIVFLCPGVAAG